MYTFSNASCRNEVKTGTNIAAYAALNNEGERQQSTLNIIKDYLFYGSVSTAKYVSVLWLFLKFFFNYCLTAFMVYKAIYWFYKRLEKMYTRLLQIYSKGTITKGSIRVFLQTTWKNVYLTNLFWHAKCGFD